MTRWWHTVRSVDRLLLAALIGSLAVNVSLGSDVYSRYRQRILQERQTAGVRIGDILPPLVAEQLGEGSQAITYESGRQTILYVYVSTCGWCQRNWDNAKAVMAANQRFRFVLLSLDTDDVAIEQYAKEVGIEGPIYYRPSDSSVQAYGFGATPVTMVIEPGGRVSKVWAGAYGSKHKDEIEEFFGIMLPGLSDAPR